MPAPQKRKPHTTQKDRGWDPVAAWYDKLVGETGSDYHRNVILPAVIRLLAPEKNQSIIDVCCGQGVLIAPLLEKGVAHITAIDASPRLIEAARQRHRNHPQVTFHVADACSPGKWTATAHDSATCVMAIHDVPDLSALFKNIATTLKPGGKLIITSMHPCFRIPRKSHWGWDANQKIQYRRLDSYTSPMAIPITTHPGKNTGEQTVFYHRPLATILSALGTSGLAVTACEELHSHRRSQANGPFSKAEHAAAEEFPLFLALTAVRL